VSRTWVSLLTACLVISGLVATPAGAATTVSINGTGAGRTFDGVGAISGGGGNSRLLIDYPEPQRTQLLDYLFRPGCGAALQVLKVEVGGDTNSTSGSEASHQHTATDLNCDRGYEWWLMEQAKARNPNIKFAALAWGAPGWIGNGNFWSNDMISYYISWLTCARDQHGLTVDYIGGWNERGHDKTWFINFKSALVARGFGGVKVLADDTSWDVATDAVNDPAFAAAVDVLGSHYVCGYRGAQTNCPSSANALATGKTLWASENGSDDDNGGAPALARGINRGYIDGKMTGYLNWPVIAALYPNIPFHTMGVAVAAQPWSGAYSIGKNAWAIAHTTQFSAPGWRYLDSGSGYLEGNRANGSYVTLRSPSTGDYSIVVETMDASAPLTFTASVSNGLSTGAVHVWSSGVKADNPSDFMVRGSDLPGGTFSVTLQPGRVYTLTTTTGQGKGTATSPAPTTMPLPYSDGFDSYALGHEAKYLSDMQGAFEASTCAAGRAGRCIRQVTPRAPIAWTQIGDPQALLGDITWANYKVSSDVLLEQAGQVSLIGRATWQRRFDARGLNSYYLRASDTGAWSLVSNDVNRANTVLSSGTVAALGTNRWHNLALTFSGSTITAQIDGATVATVTDAQWPKGQAGIGTGQGILAQFDNLSITPVAGPATPDTGRYVGYGSGRCLDVTGASQTNGTGVIIWDCEGTANEQWTHQANGSLTVYGSKCLDVPGHATTPGTGVVIWDCNGGANQQWTATADGTLVGVESGLCLDVSGAATDNQSKIVVWTCNSATNQRWTR
jgi:O-glycosyl hydrolase